MVDPADRRPARARPEAFGALVQLETPPAVVAVDRALARRLGVDGGERWSGPDPGLDVEALSAPVEVHVAATARCPAGCRSCYLDATPDGHEPTFAEVEARLEALAAAGVFRVAFGGGEATLRPDLGALGARARALGLVPTVTTSGRGLSAERAAGLRAFAQVNVSYDGGPEAYRAVRGHDATALAERAMAHLAAAGVPFGVNVVLTRRSIDALEDTVERAERLGAVEAQLLRFKPSGRASLTYLAERMTAAQVDAFPARLAALSRTSRLGLRIDCALLPFLAGADAVRPEDVRRFAVYGCEAGRSLLAVRADGASAPCSFWQDGGRPFPEAWEADPAIEAFRAFAQQPPEPCASCAFFASCRGGCRIVAGALTGDAFQPDPECPRVRRR
ncbi:MAG: radical SAM protein [Sandaracinaceae bacterium]